MPPFIAYLMTLSAYVALAICILLFAVALVTSQRIRLFVKYLAAGICGSFFGYFIFQFLSLPLILITGLISLPLYFILLSINAIYPSDYYHDVYIYFEMFQITIIIVAASLFGLYIGWRVAWEIAAGRNAMHLLETDCLLRPTKQFILRSWNYFLRGLKRWLKRGQLQNN